MAGTYRIIRGVINGREYRGWYEGNDIELRWEDDQSLLTEEEEKGEFREMQKH